MTKEKIINTGEGGNERIQVPELITSFKDLMSWNNGRYQITPVGEHMDIIVLGEDPHNHKVLQAEQADLVSRVKPDFVLHEDCGGIVYDPAVGLYKTIPEWDAEWTENMGYRRYSQYDLPEHAKKAPKVLEDLSDKLRIPIVGCDLTEAEEDIVIKRLYKADPSLKGVNNGEGLDTFTEPVVSLRDDHQVAEINYFRQKTVKPLVAIVGNAHAEHFHTRKMLKDARGYAYVKQSVKK